MSWSLTISVLSLCVSFANLVVLIFHVLPDLEELHPANRRKRR